MIIYSKIASNLISGTGKDEFRVSFGADEPFEVPEALGKSLLETFPEVYYEKVVEEEIPAEAPPPNLNALKMQVGRLRNNPERNADKIAEIEKQIAELEK